mmetsp:Transcript_28223/g.64862  ORF Transcript_28223/g.64862 Transcript_28223/m.64862 type:complete len:155 (-) Transcript_28223:434-898(-)
MPLSFYTDCCDLERLLPFCEDTPAFSAKHAALTGRLCELVEDFGLLHFIPCCVTDNETLSQVAAAADKACGYAFGALERNNHGIFETVSGIAGWEYDRVNAVADRYTGHSENRYESRNEFRHENSTPLDGSDADALARHYHEELLSELGAEEAV